MPDRYFCPEWVSAAKAGNQQAITDLYTCAWHEVSIVIRSMLRTDEATVQDLVQDTFVKAFQRLDQLDDPQKYKAWVKQIARNTTLDHLKKSKEVLFSELYDDDSIPIEIEDDDLSHLPDVALDKQESARLLHEILDSLPQMQRTVISMHYLQEMPIKEIASLLGRSENTIKVQLHKGRNNLELKIRELEQKEGIKLYSLSPLPFLLLLLRNMDFQPDMSMLGNILESATTAGSAAAGTAAIGSAAKSSASIFSKSLLGKLTAGIASAALLSGAAWAYFSSNGSNTVVPTETTVQAVETIMQTIETTVHEENENLYSELISDYSAVIRGEAPAFLVPMNPDRYSYSCTPCGSYIDGDGFFVVRADIDYAFALYDINGDGVKELFVLEGMQTEDGNWDGSIADIFTFHNSQPVLLISGEERGRVSICENGYILMVGSGGAETHGYQFYTISGGGLIPYDWAEENWGTYTVNGTACTEEEFYHTIHQHTIMEHIDFEFVKIVSP